MLVKSPGPRVLHHIQYPHTLQPEEPHISSGPSQLPAENTVDRACFANEAWPNGDRGETQASAIASSTVEWGAHPDTIRMVPVATGSGVGTIPEAETCLRKVTN